MNTKANEPERAVLLANVIESMNETVYVEAEATKRKVLAQTGSKALAQEAWMRTVARGWNVTSSIVKTLAQIGE